MPFDSLPTEKPETDDARWVREAMDLIDTRAKWAKGCAGRADPVTGEQTYCMGGAILRALDPLLPTKDLDHIRMKDLIEIIPERVTEALNEAATKAYGMPTTFWRFNDQRTTHHREMFAVMQAAYERLRWGGDQ